MKQSHSEPNLLILQKYLEKKVKYNEWNQLIKDKDTIVIDVRNEFEVKIGSFEGAINPKTKSFTDFKSFVQKKTK